MPDPFTFVDRLIDRSENSLLEREAINSTYDHRWRHAPVPRSDGGARREVVRMYAVGGDRSCARPTLPANKSEPINRVLPLCRITLCSPPALGLSCPALEETEHAPVIGI